MKKNLVLFILFILPIVAYLFFASGVNNFAKLPMLTKNIPDIKSWSTANGEHVTLNDKITILGFIGNDVEKHKGGFFNLYEKIYARNKDFKDFQMVMVLPEGTQEKVAKLQESLKKLGPQTNWYFVFADPEQIQSFYNAMHLVGKLDEQLGTPNVYIIDKKRNLRGRNGQNKKGEEEYQEGYNTFKVSDLYNNMIDDVKVILAEYRLALKVNNKAKRKI
ncbi:thioredoxin domain-containing protein [Flavobacterium stagni]|uniref:Membrane or secreted protein n=1 Tax=Flavobacterium stagni TaxID=2506421 RepID=A0A4Q1KAV4_9FLAO|nr:hypothetical protein [Flavobacterium stagni]RXR24042.1 hypothetical protein EQG61_00980 [Flavobacterium stagni]